MSSSSLYHRLQNAGDLAPLKALINHSVQNKTLLWEAVHSSSAANLASGRGLQGSSLPLDGDKTSALVGDVKLRSMIVDRMFENRDTGECTFSLRDGVRYKLNERRTNAVGHIDSRR